MEFAYMSARLKLIKDCVFVDYCLSCPYFLPFIVWTLYRCLDI